MKILSLDSSRATQSATLYDLDAKADIATNYLDNTHGQNRSSKYMPLIEDIFSSVNMKASHVDLLAVSVGPGSFTGIRTALTIAKILSSELRIKIFPLNNFELIRFEHDISPDHPVVISAGHSDYFVSLSSEYEDLDKNFFCNDLDKLASDLNVESNNLDVLDFKDQNISMLISRYIENSYQSGNLDSNLMDHDAVSPYYLRDPNINQSKKQ